MDRFGGNEGRSESKGRGSVAHTHPIDLFEYLVLGVEKRKEEKKGSQMKGFHKCKTSRDDAPKTRAGNCS